MYSYTTNVLPHQRPPVPEVSEKNIERNTNTTRQHIAINPANQRIHNALHTRAQKSNTPFQHLFSTALTRPPATFPRLLRQRSFLYSCIVNQLQRSPKDTGTYSE